jgi:hypothetical protein
MDRSPLAQEPGSPGPKTRGHLRELGPGGALTVRTQSELWDLGPESSLVLGTRRHLREPGSDLGFGAQGGLRELGPESLLITWPFCRVQVLGPRSDYRSSLQRLRLLWFRPLCDQHHTHDFSCSHDVKQ